VERCPACNVTLLEGPESPEEHSELCDLLRTTDMVELAVVKSLLEAAEMPFTVQGEEGLHQLPISWAGGFFTPGSHGATVRVFTRDLEDARRLITAEETGNDELPD
jgi:hypothetical protein